MTLRSKAKSCGIFLGKCICFPFKEHQATYNIIIAVVTALTLVWAAMTYHCWIKEKELGQSFMKLRKE